MSFGPLVSAGWLAAHLDHEGLRIVDCRWYLGEPGRGPAAYRSSHIRGAVYMDLDHDLSGAEGPGRHPLPDPAVFMLTLGRNGIQPGTVVVAYDDRGGAVEAGGHGVVDHAHLRAREQHVGSGREDVGRRPRLAELAHEVVAVLNRLSARGA